MRIKREFNYPEKPDSSNWMKKAGKKDCEFL